VPHYFQILARTLTNILQVSKLSTRRQSGHGHFRCQARSPDSILEEDHSRSHIWVWSILAQWFLRRSKCKKLTDDGHQVTREAHMIEPHISCRRIDAHKTIVDRRRGKDTLQMQIKKKMRRNNTFLQKHVSMKLLEVSLSCLHFSLMFSEGEVKSPYFWWAPAVTEWKQ
jgi:hypothetical protein